VNGRHESGNLLLQIQLHHDVLHGSRARRQDRRL
jgi:hypothetical protein